MQPNEACKYFILVEGKVEACKLLVTLQEDNHVKVVLNVGEREMKQILNKFQDLAVI